MGSTKGKKTTTLLIVMGVLLSFAIAMQVLVDTASKVMDTKAIVKVMEKVQAMVMAMVMAMIMVMMKA